MKNFIRYCLCLYIGFSIVIVGSGSSIVHFCCSECAHAGISHILSGECEHIHHHDHKHNAACHHHGHCQIIKYQIAQTTIDSDNSTHITPHSAEIILPYVMPESETASQNTSIAHTLCDSSPQRNTCVQTDFCILLL